MKKTQATTIDEYIEAFPLEIQKKLREMRKVIKATAPEAEEAIKYSIPTFILNGNLAHFAGYQHHIGFYPTPRGIAAFKKELSKYEGGKGTIQFPIDKPLPIALIKKIVRSRVKDNVEKGKAKKKK
ncbi:MAG: DUF1801 domain-containing protein [Bacteroidota bacterium]